MGYKVSDFFKSLQVNKSEPNIFSMGQVIGQACRRRLVALNVAIVTFELHKISPYISLLFQDQMIYDLHEILFYSTHDMLSDAITFTSYDMTPSILSYIHYMNILNKYAT